MNNYVVGILSLYDNNLKLFKVTAENEYQAVKQGMLLSCDNDENEVTWQNSEDYPKNLEEMYNAYEEIPFNVIEI